MIYWMHKRYHLISAPYNGDHLGFLIDGKLCHSLPRSAVYSGYIRTPLGVVLVYRRSQLPLFLALLVVAIVAISVSLWPTTEYEYFQVTYEESPRYSDNTLYCNVINEADRPVTVQFIHDKQKSFLYELQPGETLPYITIEFAPSTIRYDNYHDFKLEVQCD